MSRFGNTGAQDPLPMSSNGARLIDVMQYFRASFPCWRNTSGPGKAKQWGLHSNFDYQTADLTRHMQPRGIAVLPADQWLESYDRLAPAAWHAKMNSHNMAMMTTQFSDAPYPFRPPLLKASTGPQACAQAKEISPALSFREKMTAEWKRRRSFT
eukprot:516929-Pyramimonas_sp.AAC.1